MTDSNGDAASVAEDRAAEVQEHVEALARHAGFVAGVDVVMHTDYDDEEEVHGVLDEHFKLFVSHLGRFSIGGGDIKNFEGIFRDGANEALDLLSL